MILSVRQQKRHRYKEQTSGLCGRRRGWDDWREQHWNMYITICETDDQSKFDAWNGALKAGALGQPRRMGWGERREGSSGWQTHLHPRLIHVSVWQKPLQCCKVISLQLKLKKKKRISLPMQEISPGGGNGNLSILAWKPQTGEPDRLQSMRSQRGRHNWARAHTGTKVGNETSMATLIHVSSA